jgi:thiamine kinase-like enzyme
VWLASGLAEVGTGDLSDILDEQQLRDFDTLLCISHGDLHCDNILCASSTPEVSPRTVLIDFESAHEGHVCKDVARLEASLLVQVFEWDVDARLDAVSAWFAESVRPGNLFAPMPSTSEGTEPHLVTLAARELRWVAQQCGQGLWPIKEDEYLLALFASLLPIVRWTTVSASQRKLALVLSTLAGSALLQRWSTTVE